MGGEREIVRKDLVVHGYFSWYGEKEREGERELVVRDLVVHVYFMWSAR